MKQVRLTLHHDAETVHPMHRFVADSDAFDSYRLVHWNPTDQENVLVFHVVGDPGEYEAALKETAGVRSYDLARREDRSFSVYVRDLPDDPGERLIEAFSLESLVPIPPLEYRGDWSVRFSLVGESTDLQRAIAAVPDAIDVTVERIGEYAGASARAGGLTERQREAVRVARELGYYAVPREASVADVAARLECAPGTAAEHLRKAESTIMTEFAL